MKSTFPQSGLYAITDSLLWPAEALLGAVEQAISGGASVIQYREKSRTMDVTLVRKLLAVCRSHRVPLIINDDIELAETIGADGVHLGRHDCSLKEARQLLGDRAIIGISCYDSIESARSAEQASADYVAFGCFFASSTKPDAISAPISVLTINALTVPVVAIGGITPENGRALLDAGADLLAVISGIFGHANPKQAAANYARLFEPED